MGTGNRGRENIEIVALCGWVSAPMGGKDDTQVRPYSLPTQEIDDPDL